MCLVNCAKTMNIPAVAAAVIMAESEINSELLAEEEQKQCLQLGTMSRRDSEVPAAIKPDAIAVATQWTRRGLKRMNRKWNKMQNSKALR